MTVAQKTWKQLSEVKQYLLNRCIFSEATNLANGSANRKLFQQQSQN